MSREDLTSEELATVRGILQTHFPLSKFKMTDGEHESLLKFLDRTECVPEVPMRLIDNHLVGTDGDTDSFDREERANG